MLIILYFVKTYFAINIPIINLIIDTSLKYLTPISIISFILYIIVSLLSNKIIETAIGIVLGGLILYYLSKYY